MRQAATVFAGQGRPAFGTMPALRSSPERDVFQPARALMPPALLFAGARRKIMTYNVQNLNNGRKDGLEELASVIKQEDPDIIALQEVESRDRLARFNRDYLDSAYTHIVFPPQQPDSNHRLAFLSKENIRVVSSKSHYETQNQGKYRGKRDFLEATFETETGYRFTLFNAHFRSPKIRLSSSKEHNKHLRQRSDKLRLEEAGNAARILRAFLSQRPEDRVLVVGDFNSSPDTPTGAKVLNTLSLAEKNGDHPQLAQVLEAVYAREGKIDPETPTTRSGVLDGMYGNERMLADVKDAYVAGDLFTSPWVQASDHLPVVTEIEEPDEPAEAAAAHRMPTALPKRPRLDRIA